MSESALSLYYNQRVKQVFNHLLEFDISSSENSLHDFRVEIKKMRAIMKFLKSVYPKQKLKKTTRQLNSIFQEAGEIREYQLLLLWFQKHDLEIFIKKTFPIVILDEMVEKFHKQVHEFKHDLKDLNEHVNEYILATNEILAEQYVTDLSVQMETLIRKNCPISEWHNLRKIIKQWMYAINWIEDGLDTDISFYQKLQEAIGYWHDAQVIKETLLQKKIFLSQDVELQKSFSIANEKLNQSLKYREKQILELLNRKEIVA
ncbi:MAG: CHAD domain-containing protein [Bacteroidota bacterium]